MNKDRKFDLIITTVLITIFSVIVAVAIFVGYMIVPGDTISEKISFFYNYDCNEFSITQSEKHFFDLHNEIKKSAELFYYDVSDLQIITNQDDCLEKEFKVKTNVGSNIAVVFENNGGREMATLRYNSPYEDNTYLEYELGIFRELFSIISGIKLNPDCIFENRNTILATDAVIPYRDLGSENELVCVRSDGKSLTFDGQTELYYELIMLEDKSFEERFTLKTSTKYFNGQHKN